VELHTTNGPFYYWSDELKLRLPSSEIPKPIVPQVSVTHETSVQDANVELLCTVAITPADLNYRVGFRLDDVTLGELVVNRK